MSDPIAHNASGYDTGRKFYELRDYTPIPLIIILFFTAEPTVLSATLGTLLMMIGLIVRLFSICALENATNSADRAQLATQGLFKFVRNPIYLGDFLIVMGITIFGSVAWVIFLTFILFFIQYSFIARYEEANLLSQHGESYKKYCESTPAWIPSKLPKIDSFDWPQNIASGLNKEKRTFWSVTFLIFVMVLISL